ncbi:MAG: HpcH/HpaI aldolase/citrate lyase family protein [Hyphomicrobiales bacterium]|nr:HpcH/HpaI aldolase/citrate lyase family protein [Hyphomicrobiales bacterium]
MTPPVNRFKSRLASGEVQLGLWMSIPSPVTAEALSLIGFDWLLFDSEHAPVEVGGMQPLFQAAAAGSSAVAARPAWNDKVLIKKLLDVGAQTLLVPFVQSADEAAGAVRSTRYPPDGIRGVAGSTRASRFGLAPGYLQQANEQICTLVQIETTDALDRLEEIAAVEGVDGVFIGPSDLSASMGHIGNPAADEVRAELKATARRISAAGSVPGILATHPKTASEYLDWGYRFVAVSADLGLLLRGAKECLNEVRKAV